MRRYRLAWPDRTGLAGRIVTDSKYKIERRCAGPCELAPRFRPKTRRIEAKSLQKLERLGMHAAFRPAASAERPEVSRADLVEDRFRHDGARRIAGAKEQDIEGPFVHRYILARCALPQTVGSG